MLYRPFFYWVHKALPLVYDDALSYMELLSKVLWALNKNTEKTNEMSKVIASLVEFINKFFESDEFERILTEKLDEMAEDGTLDTMLNEITHSTKFIPTDEEHEQYVSGVCATIADWFANMANGTSDSVVGNSNTTYQKTAVIYCDNYDVIYPNIMTYDAIIDDKWTFGKWHDAFPGTSSDVNHDSVTTGGATYPVTYMNCAGFVTMLTKGRGYSVSPWAALFNNSDITGRQLARYCMEYGDTYETPWTFDFMNVLYTWRMAGIMKSSGCTPKKIVSKSGDVVTWEDDVNYLRDGDVIFCGNLTNHANRYLGIHHCLIYFRDLTALNQAGQRWGIGFKAWNSSLNDEHGYVVHCTTSSDGQTYGYKNVLRVDAFDDYVSRLNSGEILYGSQVSANALNSSKEYLATSGWMPLFNCEVGLGQRHNFASGENVSFNTVRAFASGTNNGIHSYGQYRYRQPSSSIVADGSTVDLDDFVGPNKSGEYVIQGASSGITYTHAPELEYNPTTTPVLLEIKDCYQNDGLTLQCFTLLSATPKKWERTINYAGTASDWQEIF